MSEKEIISATNNDIKDRLRQLARKNYDKGYHKGFDDAIDKVLYYLDEEINMYESAIKNALTKAFRSRRQEGRDALFVFKQYMIGLFKMVVVES